MPAGTSTRPRGPCLLPFTCPTTFEHGPASEALHGYLYTREGNPVQSRLEQALAALEGGPAALAFASGMAAGSAYLQSLPHESHVLFHHDVYHALRIVGAEFLERWGTLRPSRTVPVQFATRILMGAVCGAALTAGAGAMLLGAIVVIAGAVAGTLGGRAFRARMAAAFGRDRPAALLEDAIAVGATVTVVLASR